MAERLQRLLDRTVLLFAVGGGLGAVLPCSLHDESLAVLGAPGALPAASAATPLARGYRAAADWLGSFDASRLGLPPYTAGTHHAALWLAAAAAGLAAVFVHGAASTVGISRRRAFLAALLTTTAPAAALAATTVHVHAFLLLLGALAAWLVAIVGTRGSIPAAVALGLLCGGAHWATPVGVLLPFGALPFLVRSDASAEPTVLRRTLLAGLAVLLHGGLLFGLRRGEVLADLPTLEQVASLDLGTLGPLWLRDAGRAFLPLSVAALAAVFSSRHHRQALLLVLGSLLAAVLGCHWTQTLGDEGSFVLPLLPLAAVIAARWLSPGVTLALVLAAAGVSGTKLWLRGDWSACAEWRAGNVEIAQDKPIVLLAGPRRDAAFQLARPLPTPPLALFPTVDDPAAVAPFVAALQARTKDARVFLTDEAEQLLRDPVFRAKHAAAPALLQALETTFALQRVTARGFGAEELKAK